LWSIRPKRFECGDQLAGTGGVGMGDEFSFPAACSREFRAGGGVRGILTPDDEALPTAVPEGVKDENRA